MGTTFLPLIFLGVEGRSRKARGGKEAVPVASDIQLLLSHYCSSSQPEPSAAAILPAASADDSDSSFERRLLASRQQDQHMTSGKETYFLPSFPFFTHCGTSCSSPSLWSTYMKKTVGLSRSVTSSSTRELLCIPFSVQKYRCFWHFFPDTQRVNTCYIQCTRLLVQVDYSQVTHRQSQQYFVPNCGWFSYRVSSWYPVSLWS